MKFATCLNCIDGRVQLPVIRWITKTCSVSYVDMITEPGMDGVIGSGHRLPVHIISKVGISITRHHSKYVYVVGHYDCAGNTVDERAHKDQIRNAVGTIKGLLRKVTVGGLWVTAKWKVEKII